MGAGADAVTFFVGSILFTVGGGAPDVARSPGGRRDAAGRAAWWAAVVQSLGTLFFNVTTFRPCRWRCPNPGYDKLVWRPDAYGSICFLISGAIAYQASDRRGWRRRAGPGWWQPGVNLLGCIFFGVAAMAGYVVGSSSSMVDQAQANPNTPQGPPASSPARWGPLTSCGRRARSLSADHEG